MFENKIFSNQEKEYVLNRFGCKNDGFKENLYRIINHIEIKPKCLICGKSCRFNKRGIYGQTCSTECEKKLIRQKCIKAWGCNSPIAIPKVKEKFKNTWANHSEKQTIELVNKRKKTCLERYGVDNKAKLHETIEKMFDTNIKRYGHKCSVQGKECQEKAKQTSLKLYGVDYPMKSKIVSTKITETKRKNHTFNISKQEGIVLEKLLNKFPLTKHQYKDKIKYPYNCDFYIPEIDTWIEYQGHWSHGGSQFISSDKQLLKLNEWKIKSEKSDYMKTAIYVWTNLDVRKRTIAKENNLNYLEFFNLKEFNIWFDSLD